VSSSGANREGRRRRAPRGTLNPDVIVKAAMAVLDTDGLEALTMQRLADDLGVQRMSLYTHFREKDAILQAVGAELLARLELPDTADSDIDLLRQISRAHFRLLVDHPVLLQLDSILSNTSPNDPIGEAIFGCLQRLGIDHRRAVGLAATLARFVIGAATVYPARRAWDEDPDYWSRLHRRLAALPPETYPYTHELTREFPVYTQIEAFEFGLETLLDGIAAAAGLTREDS
jgi:AcrR family transcriptional regulator